MRQEEANASWYRKRPPQPVPAVSLKPRERRQLPAVKKPQPKFVTKSGYSVQAMSLDGVAQYQIKHGPNLVATVRTVAEITQYVNLAELEEVRA